MSASLEDLDQVCSKCGGRVPYWSDSCSRCGSVEHPPHRLRIMGAIYLVLGLALSGGILYLMMVIANIMRHSGDPHATTRFNGTPLQAVMVFGVLSFPLLVGITSILMGVSQLRHGRRNPKLVRVAMLWYLVLAASALLIQFGDLLRFVTGR